MLIEVPVDIFGIYGVLRRLCCVFRDQLLPVFAGRKPCVLVPSIESIRDSSRSLLDVNMSISSSQPFLSASSVFQPCVVLLPVVRQKLVYNNMEMKNRFNLSAYGIQEGSKITLSVIQTT